ncbi:DUF7266 family protein [Halorarius litoreus]|uniref:DUF7266 family protein n=1 Tax=Halorarius litoreus TaxID=2962676 RepID=UPI0020CB8FA0|nr:hypothetical protein [Halorarius litoreus]
MTPRSSRGVTVPTDYVLLVGITALLASGLLLGTGGFVGDQQEQAVRSGFTVVGNGLAADLTTVDRLADSLDGSGSVELDTDLPDSVAGTAYQLAIVGGEVRPGVYAYDLVLTSADPEVTVRVPVRLRRPVTADTLDGGPVVVSGSPGGLEVRDA